jgi:ubiquinone biosynthesis protein
MHFTAVESCEASAGPADLSQPRTDVSGLSALVRLAQISAIAAAHFAWWACSEIWRRIARRPATPSALAGMRLALLLEALGPTFIKVGQALSTRPDLLPPDVIAALQRLQDSVAPFSGAPAALSRAFGRPVDALFAAFDPTPIASASIAQVHRAQLADGRIVAVKIRRPGIEARVARDLWWLTTLARLASAIPAARSMPLQALSLEIAGPIREQLDLTLEARNNRRFRAMFANAERIRIPALVDELCAESVLTMEYVDQLGKVTSAALTEPDRRGAPRVGQRGRDAMIFDHGFVHADMHPGNIFVRAHGQVVLLDFGLVARLQPPDLADFVDFFYALATNHGSDCAAIVLRGASRIGRRFDAGAFERAMIDLVRRHSRLRSREFELVKFVWELMAVQRRFTIAGSTAFITTLTGMVVFEGVCKTLAPDCDFQEEARGFLITARYRRPAPRPPQRA